MAETDLFETYRSLRTTDKILLGLLGGLAVTEEVLESLPTPRSVVRGLWTTLPAFKGIGKYTLRRAFLRLLEAKCLESSREGSRVRYQLTQSGLDHLYRKFPLLKLQQKTFDGHFRIVIYDIDEVERKLRGQLRRGLQKLGFCYLQKSVWISPYAWDDDLAFLFKKLKTGDKVFIFKSSLTREKTTQLLKAYWPDLVK